MTDGARMYPAVGREFASHSSVDHAAGEYVRHGFHHSNTIENYFSILKRGITGTFRSPNPYSPFVNLPACHAVSKYRY